MRPETRHLTNMHKPAVKHAFTPSLLSALLAAATLPAAGRLNVLLIISDNR